MEGWGGGGVEGKGEKAMLLKVVFSLTIHRPEGSSGRER